MIFRINRTGGLLPVYVNTLGDLKGWTAPNPGEVASFDRLKEADARDLLNALTRRVETLSVALHLIASWDEGSQVTQFCEPRAASHARVALQAAGLVPVGSSPA